MTTLLIIGLVITWAMMFSCACIIADAIKGSTLYDINNDDDDND